MKGYHPTKPQTLTATDDRDAGNLNLIDLGQADTSRTMLSSVELKFIIQNPAGDDVYLVPKGITVPAPATDLPLWVIPGGETRTFEEITALAAPFHVCVEQGNSDKAGIRVDLHYRKGTE